MNGIERSEKNPILKPDKKQSWEALGVFNGCPALHGRSIYLLYRALSLPHYHLSAQTEISVSDIGIAKSRDGVNFADRKRFIVPEYPWERFGCEDPRVVRFEGKYYIFYTALSDYPFTADGIKVGLAISKDMKTVEEKHLVMPWNSKAMTLFPERINGQICAILTVDTDRPPVKIAVARFNEEKEIWSEEYWRDWRENLEAHALPLLRKPEDHMEVGAPPIKTKHGWLVIYSYIKNYAGPRKLFTIEAVLLDLNDPSKIIARSQTPLMVPEEEYELYGMIPNVIFPTGALVKKGVLSIYYGATDTTCCLATVKLAALLDSLLSQKRCVCKLKRAVENPIITPKKENSWEAKATFNPAAIYEDGRVHIVYRAMSEDNTSVFGYASSRDGINIDYRSPEPIYIPSQYFEEKLVPGGNSGCEDPRITKIDGNLFMTYTAYDGKHPPRISLSSIPLKSFLNREWRKWTRPVLISPPEFDNKDACIFPEKVKGRYMIFHRFGTDIDLAFVDSLNFDGKTWLEEERWLSPRMGMWDSQKVGIAAPPIKTEAGWILFYHGVSEEDHVYRVGALLLNLKDPTKIIGRTAGPIMEPEAPYEISGQIKNVVFPCGALAMGDKIYVYYGAADSVVGVASVKTSELLHELQRGL